MAKSQSQTSDEDFNPKDLIRVVSEHEELISRVGELEKLDNFTAAFCKAACEHVKVGECLNQIIIRLIQKDDTCRSEIRKLIEDNDKRTFKAMLLKFGWWVAGGVIYVAGLITSHLINKFL